MVTCIRDTVAGLLRLGMLTARSGFRLQRSAYWRWRAETAFGTAQPRKATLHEVLEYARWVGQMKRLEHS